MKTILSVLIICMITNCLADETDLPAKDLQSQAAAQNDTPANKGLTTGPDSESKPPAVITKPTIDIKKTKNNSPQEFYPTASLINHEEGAIILAFDVGVDGLPSNISVDVSSGYPNLDDAAINYLKDVLRYIPGTSDGRPVTMQHKVRVTFKSTCTSCVSTGQKALND